MSKYRCLRAGNEPPRVANIVTIVTLGPTLQGRFLHTVGKSGLSLQDVLFLAEVSCAAWYDYAALSIAQ